MTLPEGVPVPVPQLGSIVFYRHTFRMASIVVRINIDGSVAITAFNPNGNTSFIDGVNYSAVETQGYWSWPGDWG